MRSRRLLTGWLVCTLLAATPLFLPAVRVAAASPSAPAARTSPTSNMTPFLPLTPQGREATRHRTMKRGGGHPLERRGSGDIGALATSPTTSTHRNAASRPNAHKSASFTIPPPESLTGFNGTSQAGAIHSFGSDQEVTPPNEDIAAGLADEIEVANSTLFIFNRTGTQVASDDLNTFMDVSPGYHSSDPRIIYDASGGRFWLTITEVPDSYSSPGDCPTAAPVLIAVSGSSNPLPLTAWTVYELPMATFGGTTGQPLTEFGDQPGLGIASNTVAVTFDDFTCANVFNGSEIDILQKTDFEHGTGTSSVDDFYDGPFAPQPVQEFGSIPVQYIVSNQSDCSVECLSGSPATLVQAFTGTPEAGGGVTAQPFEYVPMSSTAIDAATGFLPPADQPSPGPQLQTNDDRFLNAVWENGEIAAADGTSCQPLGDTVQRDCLDYVEIEANSTASVAPTLNTQMNGIALSGADYFYPAVSFDSAGNVLMVFDESSTAVLPSIEDAAFINSGTELTAIQTLHTSSTYYNGADLFPQACDSEGCRWGDYSGAAQDPVNPKDVWVVSGSEDGTVQGACTTSHACWNTFIDDITYSAPTLTSMTPLSGPMAGGTIVTIHGTDFAPDTTATWWAGAALTLINLTPTSFTFVTPPATQSTEIAPFQAVDALGQTTENSQSEFRYVALANYVPITPFRLMDTRKVGGPFGPGAIRAVQVTEVGPAPVPLAATAVVVNVTEVNSSAPSLLTVFPYGTARPNASNLNFPAHTVIANLVTVTLTPFNGEGWIDIYNAVGSVNVLVDVEGYFTPDSASDVQGLLHPISPVRVCDTRKGSPTPFCSSRGSVGPGRAMVINFASVGGVPGDGSAEAAVVNLTGVAGTAATYLSLFPTNSSGGCTVTGTSTVNLAAGAVQANRVIVALGPASTGGPHDSSCVFNSAGSINVLVDADGWFGSATAPLSPAGYQYQALAPTRICDTRVVSAACATGLIGTNVKRLITVAGHDAIPAVGSPTTVVAIVANLTAVTPSTGTYLSIYPANLPNPPVVSDVNVAAGATLPNLVVVELDNTADTSAGDLLLYNNVGSVNAIIDVEGWFQ